ncbi:hypothetical protein XM38_043880 [Halomicronema hongdechloris C2206]|uniref:site-specific DNA-methyltransferase (adenine-specific) n=1 Tax=Halomicronema hongdechloris C2206 TaxID=1641165 RepID=A0A1Z3HSX2_9CYAN|nr:hypothetical protein [Halomicronema hongdechloris]ASC73421.1 hypothetical protein XM38_043880 [Halomicronema hongdechloris C2206]
MAAGDPSQPLQSQLQGGDSHWPGYYPRFDAAYESLFAALEAVPTAPERASYAITLICRLILLYGLQRRGWLGDDEWYLQNQYGQSQQRGRDRFFHQVLQPLCYQGLLRSPQGRPAPWRSHLRQLPAISLGLFQPSPLEQQYPSLQIPDAAFEPLLEWLGDLPPGEGLPLDLLGQVFEAFVTAQTQGTPTVTAAAVAQHLCDRTLLPLLQQKAETLFPDRFHHWADVLMQADSSLARALLAIPPALVDPACGAGTYLLTAHRQLLSHYAPLVGQLPPEEQPDLLRLHQHISRHIYGIDAWPVAVQLTQLQLHLQRLAATPTPADLQRFPPADTTLFSGNALVGLVQVDSERFEAPAPTLPRQGSLLQPLAAEDYRSILQARHIHLEYYRAQTEPLIAAGDLASQGQANLMWQQLHHINHTAQIRLNQLLLSEFSQHLGIHYQQPDAYGRHQRRVLTTADMDALHPFHWGFHCHDILQKGGFDGILCQPPPGLLRPNLDEFFLAFRPLFQAKGIDRQTLNQLRHTILQHHPDLATAWRDYQGHYSYLRDFIRRSSDFRHATRSLSRRAVPLYRERLFLERCLHLLRPGGYATLLVSEALTKPNAAPLQDWLHHISSNSTWTAITAHTYLLSLQKHPGNQT